MNISINLDKDDINTMLIGNNVGIRTTSGMVITFTPEAIEELEHDIQSVKLKKDLDKSKSIPKYLVRDDHAVLKRVDTANEIEKVQTLELKKPIAGTHFALLVDLEERFSGHEHWCWSYEQLKAEGFMPIVSGQIGYHNKRRQEVLLEKAYGE